MVDSKEWICINCIFNGTCGIQKEFQLFTIMQAPPPHRKVMVEITHKIYQCYAFNSYGVKK
jgi:hypothetical protein